MKIYSSKNHLTRKLGLCAGTLALSLAVLSPLNAQDTAEEKAGQLEVMIVTASKRAQTLQDTPIAVSVVTGADIEKAQVIDIFDLQATVPALSVAQGFSTASAGYSIRGFGGVATNSGIEPSVGVFVDGVYRSRPGAAVNDLLNLERVEVLRGPQSSLFGKNASVGVISFITKEPEFDSEKEVSLTLGNYNTVRVDGNFTGPISDNLAYRFAANYNQRDGYATNLVTGSDLNNRDRYSAQAQLLYFPNDDLKLKLIADLSEINESCCYTSNIVAGPLTTQVVDAIGNVVLQDPFSYENYLTFDPINDVRNSGISFHIEKTLDFADFTSITAYRSNESFTIADVDTSSADLLINPNSVDADTLSQEFRLASTDENSRVRWLVGASYFDETLDVPGSLFYGTDFRTAIDAGFDGAFTLAESLLPVAPGTFGQAGQGVSEERGQENTSWSVFTNLDFKLTEKLTGTLGLSYIDDQKSAFVRQENTDVFSSLDFVAIGFAQAFAQGLVGAGVNPNDPAAIAAFAAANPAIFAAIQSGAQAAAQNPATNPLLALQPLQFNTPFLDFPNSVENGESADDKFTYVLRAAYDISDDLGVYGSYSTGFKATSWNLSRDSRPFASDLTTIVDANLAVPNLTSGTRFAGPEETTVAELGLKMQRDDLSLNLAIFDQVVEGFQSNTFNGAGFDFANAGKQSTRGIELDTQWAATDALTLSFSGAFYDPVFDEFVDSTAGDISGQQVAGVPEVSTSVAFNYAFNIGNNDAFIRADWRHNGATDYTNDTVDQQLINFQEEYNLVNASFGINLPGQTDITLWGRNIFGEEYVTAVFPAIAQEESFSGFANQPATYGVKIRKQF